MKIGLWIFSVFLTFGLISCDKSDEGICFYYSNNAALQGEKVSQLTTLVTNDLSVTISGGNGDYSVVSDNQEILTAELKNSTINITVHRTGNANIIVSDTKYTSQLSVTIISNIANYSVIEINAAVEIVEQSLENDELTTQFESEIMKKLREVGALYRFIYNSKNAGKIIVFPLKDSNDSFEGSFSIENTHGTQYISMNYNDGKTDVYRSDDGYLIKDFIEEYQQKYPDINFLRVEGGEKITRL